MKKKEKEKNVEQFTGRAFVKFTATASNSAAVLAYAITAAVVVAVVVVSILCVNIVVLFTKDKELKMYSSSETKEN